MNENGFGERFRAFKDAVNAALQDADITGVVSVSFCADAGRHAAELDHISATPMRHGHGSRAMRVIISLADRMGMPIELRVADATDDPCEWGGGDQNRPPSEADLIGWYSGFGFETVGFGASTRMRRDPEEDPIPRPGAAPG